ncbi:hypothetical protein Hypma_010075 [Hypsizygus marmoreus]|uniref:Uncharacterized protein n=1 Tax=Hypsizygus marmoreus TaxID=39966 RepID=A0A369JPU0_HYPMA|nr:hypothetical protein Hypma_010075 [Hypsizygus marmoreus]
MPSIRVRGSSYSTLNGSPTLPARRPTLANLFLSSEADSPEASTSDSAGSPVPPRMQRSLPIMRAQIDTPTESPAHSRQTPGRERSSTTTSRVHAFCTSNSRRYPRSSAQENGSHSSMERIASPFLVPHDGMVTLEGPQAEVIMRSNGQPGIIGSSLSLPSYANDVNTHLLDDDSSISEVHHDDVVEHLDVIDPQVGTVSNLTNAANTILIPPLSWYSRKPVVVLTTPSERSLESHIELGGRKEKHLRDSLDRHVDDVLRRPSKFRRTMLGVWSFLKTPMGIITAIYGFLVVFWGAAIVLFLAKMINLHNADLQGFWVEVSSQVENGLFTVTGIGLIPSRVLDTYRIYWIWHYKRKTRKLRAKAGLPQLFDVDDLPDPAYDPNYVHILTEKEEKDLHRQQRKFRHHQTWYRPHGTETHRAFPINTALLICLLSDGNSIFQIMLCATMWGLDRFQRPAWSTGILIPASFLCGILAAVFIWRGGQKTKRVAEVEERLRAALAADTPTYATGSDGSRPASIRLSGAEIPRAAVEKVQDPETAVDEHMTVPPSGEKGLLPS